MIWLFQFNSKGPWAKDDGFDNVSLRVPKRLPFLISVKIYPFRRSACLSCGLFTAALPSFTKNPVTGLPWTQLWFTRYKNFGTFLASQLKYLTNEHSGWWATVLTRLLNIILFVSVGACGGRCPWIYNLRTPRRALTCFTRLRFWTVALRHYFTCFFVRFRISPVIIWTFNWFIIGSNLNLQKTMAIVFIVLPFFNILKPYS